MNKKVILGSILAILLLLFWGQINSVQLEAEVDPNPTFDDGLRQDGPAKYGAAHRLIRTSEGEDWPAYQAGDIYNEFVSAKRKSNQSLSRTDLDWINRGPGNVGGRTRGLVVDRADTTNSTWYAGSVGGGVWKTTDRGNVWTLLTPDIPNLATSTIAMANNSDSDIIYVGTGEGFGNVDQILGNGMLKSTDRGETWELLESTLANNRFSNITRIVVNPDDANELLISSVSQRINGNRTSYIMKSVDGGETWSTQYSSGDRVQQLVMEPGNFNTIYAAVNRNGVLKSVDAGENWERVFNADPGGERRIELDIAPSNPGVIYLSCEVETGSRLLYTRDTFNTIQRAVFKGKQPNWLANQGWYDNTLAVNPYNDSLIWVAGQGSIMELAIGNEETEVKLYGGHVLDANFIQLINNSFIFDDPADLANNLLEGLPYSTNLSEDDIVTAEIRFSPFTKSQVHLFNVDLADFSFSYDTMIQVPFLAWDLDANEQINMSVFDLDGDRQWTYKDYTDEESAIHDIVMLHKSEYTGQPDMTISTTNPFEQGMYYAFMGRHPDYEGDTTKFSFGNLRFNSRTELGMLAEFVPVTDGYSQYVDVKPVGSKGVHVDHHNLIFLPKDSSAQTFALINANDGGVAFSDDNGETFIQTGDGFNDGTAITSIGYNTSQWYGIDKRPGESRYVGGTQDNGSWVSPKDPEELSSWVDAPSGDGFEAAWHYEDPNLILESSQRNVIFKSRNEGVNWERVELPVSGGPFITRIASSKKRPDVVFVSSEEGILRSPDFGDTWDIIEMPSRWRYNSLWGPPIKISLSNPDIVWTGGNMSGNNGIAVSFDGGLSFENANNYTKATMGTVTGIATHPSQDSTAYTLFSQANTPKVLRTTDAGQTWEDLSGFVSNAADSDNGFPDVATYTILVMPFDENWIWVGTEIGLIESRNGGKSWKLADNGFPSASIWDMKLIDDEVIIATHGRGVWTVNVSELLPLSAKDVAIDNVDLGLKLTPNPVQNIGRISFELKTKSSVLLNIYSINGQRLISQNQGELSGNNEISFDAAALEKGTYIAEIITSEGRQATKFIVN